MNRTDQNNDHRLDPRRYDDIIEMNRPASLKHVPMPVAERAAQFAPFAAVVGHGAAINEAYLEHLAAGDGTEIVSVEELEDMGPYLQEP